MLKCPRAEPCKFVHLSRWQFHVFSFSGHFCQAYSNDQSNREELATDLSACAFRVHGSFLWLSTLTVLHLAAVLENRWYRIVTTCVRKESTEPRMWGQHHMGACVISPPSHLFPFLFLFPICPVHGLLVYLSSSLNPYNTHTTVLSRTVSAE